MYNRIVKQIPALLLFLFALALLVFAVSILSLHTDDFEYYYYPAIQAFLNGSSLYDANSPAFYNAPWLLGLWMPFAFFPYAISQYANTAMIVLSFLGSLWLLRAPKSVMLMSIFMLPAYTVIMHGQMDGIILFGIAIGYVAVQKRHAGLLSVALLLLAIKPISVILVALWFLGASRQWKAVLLSIGAVIVNSFFLGWDWIFRYVIYSMNHPVDAARVELWRTFSPWLLVPLAILAVAALAFVVWRHGFTDWTFGLSIATNLVIAPYVLWAHFVLLVPILLFLARRNVILALVLYLASWLIPVFGMVYPIAALVILWLTYGISTSIVKSTDTSSHSPATNVPFGRAITPL